METLLNDNGHNWLLSPLVWLLVPMLVAIVRSFFHTVKYNPNTFVDYEDRKIKHEEEQVY